MLQYQNMIDMLLLIYIIHDVEDISYTCEYTRTNKVERKGTISLKYSFISNLRLIIYYYYSF